MKDLPRDQLVALVLILSEHDRNEINEIAKDQYEETFTELWGRGLVYVDEMTDNYEPTQAGINYLKKKSRELN